MSLLQDPATDSLAQRAAANLRANAAALEGKALQGAALDAAALEWTLARDGVLTARRGGEWLSGCSVPFRSAQWMIRLLQVRGSLCCLLCPTHAAQIAALLDKLDATQGLIVLLPDASDLPAMLSCHDFSIPLRAGRLFVCAGDAWATQLQDLYDRHPGLAVPSQFVRLPITDADTTTPIIQMAQSIFSRVADQVGRQINELKVVRSSAAQWCVVAPSGFALWQHAGDVLRHLAQGQPTILVDPDRPLESAPLAIARAASTCNLLLAANLGRSDLPDLVHPETPWITWITTDRLPAFPQGSPGDRLILVDPALKFRAIQLGWPSDRITLGGWPGMSGERASMSSQGDGVAMMIDLPDLAPPKNIEDFSSLRLIWETIARDLRADPFKLDDSPQALVRRYQRRMDIPDEQMPMEQFVQSLVIPAHAIGLARALVDQKFPLRLYGAGWGTIDGLAASCAGEIRSTSDLACAIQNARVVLDPFHQGDAHPLYAIGRAVVSSRRTPASLFWQNLRAALARPTSPTRSIPVLSMGSVRELVDPA